LTEAAKEQSSDIGRALHMLSWLDEEHRRDKAEIARLQQRLESQVTETAELARRIQELESRLSGVQAQQARLPEFGHTIERSKKELVDMIEALEEERRRAEREATRLRLADVEAQSRAVADLRKRIEVLPEVLDRLDARQSEDRRLSQDIVSLRTKLDEIEKSVGEWPRRAAFIEEQRIQDSKRIAQLQQEMAQLFRRLEPYSGRLELHDEQINRLGGSLEEVRSEIADLGAKQAAMSESHLQDQAEISRQIAEWETSLEEHLQKMERYSKEIRSFRETHAETERVLDSLTQLEERLQRDMHQVAEMQRLSEERLRREWEEWQEATEKRRLMHEAEISRMVAEVQNRIDELRENIADTAANVKALLPEIERLWKSLENDAAQRVADAQERLAIVTRSREGQQ